MSFSGSDVVSSRLFRFAVAFLSLLFGSVFLCVVFQRPRANHLQEYPIIFSTKVIAKAIKSLIRANAVIARGGRSAHKFVTAHERHAPC